MLNLGYNENCIINIKSNIWIKCEGKFYLNK